MLWFMLVGACAPESTGVVVPEAHDWIAEGELVVSGLEEAQSLWLAGQQGPARILAERVYTERFEPRLEPALRRMQGEEQCASLEYRFGALLAAIEGKDGRRLAERVDGLEREVRTLAAAAERAFPASADAPTSAPPPREARPVIPDVPPNWELGAETRVDPESGVDPQPGPDAPQRAGAGTP